MRVSAKALAFSSYCYKILYLYDRQPWSEEMKLGYELHKEFNFIGEEKYEKELNGYTIVGVPDRVGENYIVEFKTGWFKWEHIYILQLKIYLWLTGYNQGIILYLNPRTRKVYRVVRLYVDLEYVRKEIAELLFKVDKKLIRGDCSKCPFKDICGIARLETFINSS